MHVCNLPEGSALTTHTIGQRQHDKAPGNFPLFYGGNYGPMRTLVCRLAHTHSQGAHRRAQKFHSATH